jgi:hypothetical protein
LETADRFNCNSYSTEMSVTVLCFKYSKRIDQCDLVLIPRGFQRAFD